MPAAVQDLVIEQGATWVLDLRWLDETGQPVDLTGCVVRSHIRRQVEDVEVLLALHSDAPGSGVTFGALDDTGQITITVSAARTAPLNFRNGVYDLEVETPVGVVTRLLQGQVILSREVTR